MIRIKSYFKTLENKFCILATTMLIIIMRVYLFNTEIHAQEISELITISENTRDVPEEETFLIPHLWSYISPYKQDIIALSILAIYVTVVVTFSPPIVIEKIITVVQK